MKSSNKTEKIIASAISKIEMEKILDSLTSKELFKKKNEIARQLLSNVKSINI